MAQALACDLAHARLTHWSAIRGTPAEGGGCIADWAKGDRSMSVGRNHIPVRALVIDDDPEICRRMEAVLREEHYLVDALTRFDPSADGLVRGDVDVAFVDLRMPDCDGSSVIAHIRNYSPRTRVVALAAFPDQQIVAEAQAAGASEVISKPIDSQHLLDVMRRELAVLGIPGHSEAEFNRHLGERIRRMRFAAGLRQQDIASRCGITAAQLSQIELGKTATSTWTLARICAVLRVRIATVFES